MTESTGKQQEARKAGPAAALLGDTPGRVLVRLVVLSLLVGFAMSVFGVSPRDLFASIERLFAGLFESGWETVRLGLEYAATGAMVVLPVWVVLRLLSLGRRRG